MPDFRTYSFRSGSKSLSVVAALLAGSILAGCTAPGGGGYVSRNEPTYLRLTEERIFAQSLRQRYLELATYAYDRGDVARSDFYSLRALMAVEGKLAEPTELHTVSLPSGTAEEAASAHARLTSAMSSGVRTGAPDLAARAQAAYDCWLLEAGPEGDAAIAQSCRYNTFETLARLEGASVGAQIAHAGGHEYPAPQSYVITSATPSQTIQTNGVTIEVIQQPASHGVTYHPAQPAPSYAMVEHAAPAMVQTVPYAETIHVGPLPEFEAPAGYQPVPVIYRDDAALMTQEIAHAPMPVQTIDLGPYEERVMTLPAQPTYTDLTPIQQEPVAAMAETVEPLPAETYTMTPVYGTEPVEAMPSVAMSTGAIEAAGAADALMSASATMQSDFAVYFGFDSDEITPEAEDVLIDTVERIRLSGGKRVTLTGFTDSMGDARYNQLLAMRRAQSVRKYLSKALGSDVKFEMLPIGEVAAVQNGGDGVMEALNRRVEVAIQ